MERRNHRQRQQLAEYADDQERQRRAGDKPDQRADRGKQDHLRQIDREDVTPGGAQRLERGDDVGRRSIWLLTALATPTPPTRSAARPTRVRNWVKRLMVRSSCGDALLLLRIHQPA